MTHLLRRLIRGLRGRLPEGERPLFNRHTHTYFQAVTLIRAFYVLVLFFSFNNITANSLNWLALTHIEPLWPLAWVRLVQIPTAVYLIGFLSIIGPLAAVLWTENRLARLVAFISFLQLVAFLNSFGKINHPFHSWLAFAFIFIFLPHGGWAAVRLSITHKQTFLLTLASAQILFMSFYSLSGGWKIFTAFTQISLGQTYHTFHPYAMSQQVAYRLLQTNSESAFGWLIIEYPWLGTLPYLAAVYIELFAIVAAFRPSLHQVWGTLLILFHMATWLTMTITFNINIILLGLFFLLSPFAPAKFSWPNVLNSLPLFNLLPQFKFRLKKR